MFSKAIRMGPPMLRCVFLTEEKETGTLSPLLFEDTVQRKPSEARRKAALAMEFVGC